jgi:hypothetical protein
LASAVFPPDTSGYQLDILARQPLWHAGLDYAHGTGHGVGTYLGVHEGPQSVAKKAPWVPLQPGMILSNEPGYYVEGEYGIRIENLVVVRDSETVGMLEFTGAGIGAVENELQSMESHMAQQGSRMLAPEVGPIETATATSIKTMAENSELAGIVKSENKQLSRLWEFTLQWAGLAAEEPSFQMNTDFLPASLSGNDLVALVSSWQSGAISKETLFYNLQQGEIVPDDATFDGEEAKIEEEQPEPILPVEPEEIPGQEGLEGEGEPEA